MKLTARKTIVAAFTAAALTSGTIAAAPAYAQSSNIDTGSVSQLSSDENTKDDENTDNNTDGDNGKAKKPRVDTTIEAINKIVKLITTIVSLFTAVISITTTADRLAKAFAPK